MSAHSGRLQHAIKDLKDKWVITNEFWDDANARDFERLHVIPLTQHAKHAVIGMEKLSEIIGKIRVQCKEPD
jgi:hypothetical protein